MSYFLRNATPLDAGGAGAILHRFNRDTPWMPKLHSEAETISYCGAMIDRGWVTVAESEPTGQILGFLARDGAEVCSLYLAPGACGQGIGRALLAAAKTAQPRLVLHTFQANLGAQRFYLREGFFECARGDGSANDEGLPDIAYEWTADAGVAA